MCLKKTAFFSTDLEYFWLVARANIVYQDGEDSFGPVLSQSECCFNIRWSLSF